LAIQAGTTRLSMGSIGFGEGIGAAEELSASGAVLLPDPEPFPLSEVKGTGLAAGAAWSFRGGGLF